MDIEEIRRRRGISYIRHGVDNALVKMKDIHRTINTISSLCDEVERLEGVLDEVVDRHTRLEKGNGR